MATEVERKEQEATLNRRRNFGLILAVSAAALWGAGMIGPALMLPGVLIDAYYTLKKENQKHGVSWGKALNLNTIFQRKSHGDGHSVH